jgi:hypothetical protein
MNYPTDLVFAAACTAQRINDAYVKTVKWPDVAKTEDTREANKIIVSRLLQPESDPSLITPEDHENGGKVRRYFQALTFKILQGKVLSEFDSNALAIANREEVSGNYEIAVVSSFPASYERSVKRDTAENRVRFATGGYVGTIGQKVTLEIEVLRSFYSQQWATYYVTAITPDDQALFFSFKDGMEEGAKVKIAGTVKSLKDTQTQLNRVRIYAA